MRADREDRLYPQPQSGLPATTCRCYLSRSCSDYPDLANRVVRPTCLPIGGRHAGCDTVHFVRTFLLEVQVTEETAQAEAAHAEPAQAEAEQAATADDHTAALPRRCEQAQPDTGPAPMVMQSNHDFTVGGSLSVNCHGWHANSEPIAGTVQSLRLLTADGDVVPCSSQENPELFHLALGGYGMFGAILEAVHRSRTQRALQEAGVRLGAHLGLREKLLATGLRGRIAGRDLPTGGCPWTRTASSTKP